jgi:hypothetical protein
MALTEQLTTFQTGQGSIVEIIPLTASDFVFPDRIAITATAASAKNATTITVSLSTTTVGQTLKLPVGTCLKFTDPVSGISRVVEVGTAVSLPVATGSGPYTGSGSIALIANHEPILINSTSSNYIPLEARTTAAVDIKINDESLFTFDSAFFKQGQAVSGEGGIKCSGAYSDNSAGLRTIQALTVGAFSLDLNTRTSNPSQQFWAVITLLAPSSAFSKGTVIRAICYNTALPIKVEAGKIITQDLDFKCNGSVFIDRPTVA